ncbi:MAG: AMP-binding protein, partial [Clostridiales Family XIII bacterium]|nr:AMP-binding protein [Clostridiales Family XIII bacterium]
FIQREKNSSLRIVSLGGETFPHIGQKRFDVRIFNGYGLTECVSVAGAEIKEGQRRVTVGRPATNVEVYVTDDRQRLVPLGEKGEICVAGPALSAGYLNLPEKTAEHFLKNPFNEEAGFDRLFRTGDVGRISPEGEIEISGRVDFQTNIRGYRVEPEEVDVHIRAYPGVRESVTVAADGKGDAKRLVAYIAADGKIDGNRLKKALSENLPPYMIPSAFVYLDKLPRNANGKVDRQSLPPPLAHKDDEPPENETEKKLAEIWTDVLGLEARHISAADDFFELGGDSLRAVVLSLEIQNAFGTEITPAEVYRLPVLRELASFLTLEAAYKPMRVFCGAGDRTPIFFVHTGNSGPELYEPLARRLPPDQPFYGFEHHNMFHGGAGRIRGIENLALKYIGHMREWKPCGPYILGGWSFGGLVAFEMALRLEAAGEAVEHLYLLDPSVASVACSPQERQALEKLQGMSHYREYLSKDPLFDRFRKMGLIDRLVENNREISIEVAEYVPAAVYGGRATLFKATKFQAEDPDASPEAAEAFRRMQEISARNKDNGFGAYTKDLRIIEIPEIHDAFMRGDAAEVIASTLRSDIGAAPAGMRGSAGEKR